MVQALSLDRLTLNGSATLPMAPRLRLTDGGSNEGSECIPRPPAADWDLPLILQFS